MGRLVLGLDIGITSVGYGIIDIDNNKFVDYGVRLFKEGTAENNETRRTKRGGRRLKRRKTNRIQDMQNLLEKANIKQPEYKSFHNPYEVRVKGLTKKLSNDELTCAILHITKNRGTTLEALETTEGEDIGTKNILTKNSKELRSGKYICQVQLERLNNVGKVRGTDNNFKTEDYINEAKEILSHQDLNDNLKEEIIEIIARRRKYFEGPGSEKSPTIYGRWTDFGVEPIDLIEKMRGKCSVFSTETRAPKYAYTAELFNLLNDLNNLSIENEKLSFEDKAKIIHYVNEHGGITPLQLSKLLDVKLENITGFRIDKNEKPLLTDFKGYKQIKKIFDKNNNNEYVKNKDMLDEIIEIITTKKGITERKIAIQNKYSYLDEVLVDELSQIKGISQYHSLSLKAMKIINEEMLKSSLNQMQVLHELKIFDKYRKTTKGQKNIKADDEAILSPVAKRAQRETFKVINKLREIYGEFDSIVIETTRDKNSNEERARINKFQKTNEQNNKIVDEALKTEGFNPQVINGKTKMKVRLYLEQDGKTAYTLDPIDLRTLINDPTAYEIDHIIPISISLDDSFNNKVLVSHKENQDKGNLTPIDAFLKGKLNGNLDKYKSYIMSNKKLSYKKRGYLMYERNITKFSNIQDFIARNLVDTSYANRVVLNVLSQYFKDNNIPTKVHTIRGSATSMFRKRINLDKDRTQDYMHHAIDALIVASIKKLNLFSTYLAKYNINQLYDDKTGELIPVGDEREVLDPIYIEFIKNLKTIHEESYQYYNGLIRKNDMKFKPIKISHKVDTKPNRQVADETIYSTRLVNNEHKIVKKYSDIYEPKFDKLTNSIINNENLEQWLMYNNDPKTFDIIKTIILDHFNTYQNDSSIYAKEVKKGKTLYKLKGANNPLTAYKEEHGKVRKYSKKNNGPEMTSMKYYDGTYNSGIDISSHYQTDSKKVVLLQVSPYRTDFYVSPEGKYKFVTIRYKDVFYKKSINKYVINNEWYQNQKEIKKITDEFQFVCSLHHDELIGLQKKDGDKYVYDLSTENGGQTLHYHGNMEILKFTATNDDIKNIFEVKPIYTYSQKRLRLSIGTFIKIKKYATDVLGNLYEVKDNVLKLEFE